MYFSRAGVTWWKKLRRHADIQDRKTAAKDRAGLGTVKEVIDWSQVERDKFRAIAQEAWADYAKKSPLAQEAYDAHIKFMKDYGLLQ